ncbi:hypothetical protein ASPVEDRAFT_371158 [Aspergillus versicolor CBS 583.65]|uniref:Zn(2)-C6 fungal-type domain-containing protein n=1 Tax=Aspergillus versicolor CBS 583.65 TaxID=1036611 RepID=A0A1L9Q1D5_ASPVE|nr:uncharacterized protein ASPVEDRAFT_371158 [Aspergillus versicolor CBS 583.65]OJJ07594.1 hypothetical protein ASPVEDRAFT_371158 [Aspergillus versicolor CBS 583.65]
MSFQRPTARTSCRRCQLKKTRCNKVDPRCDKCEAAGAECIYVPRKSRPRKPWGVDDQNILSSILSRLDRLEDHCELDRLREDCTYAARSMSVSSASSGVEGLVPIELNPGHGDGSCDHDARGMIRGLWNQFNHPATRSEALSGILCHLKPLESCILQSEKIKTAVEAAIEDPGSFTDYTALEVAPDPPMVPRDVARKWIKKYHDCHQVNGPRTHLDKDFLMALPDLLETRHVQIDYTAQIIYYNVLLHGSMLDHDFPTKRDIVNRVSESCIKIGASWLELAGSTAADLSAACIMVSLALEEAEFELAWKALGHASSVARTLGYFWVDGKEPPQEDESSIRRPEVERNQQRFEFWHLLRMDCMFRLSFGKPTLIPAGSWAVNFPDPTITGNDDPDMRFVQIHFLASMRQTLVMLKYLDKIDGLGETLDEKTAGDLAMQIHMTIETWNPDQLLRMTTNHVDAWFALDILLGAYKLLIILDLHVNGHWNNVRLPSTSVDLARRSLEVYRAFMGSTSYAHWGTSLTLLHQFIPFVILSTHVIQSQSLEVHPDLELVYWMRDFLQTTAQERVKLRPVVYMMMVMARPCEKATDD